MPERTASVGKMATHTLVHLSITLCMILFVCDQCLCAGPSRLPHTGPPRATAPDDLTVVISPDDGRYELLVKGQTWLRSSPTFFSFDGKMHSTGDGSLVLKDVDKGHHGEDALGPWEGVAFTWAASGTGGTTVRTSIKKYKYLPAVVFGQEYHEGANDTSVGDVDKVISGFPSFQIDDRPAELGYLSYGGIMVGITERKLGRWSKDAFSIIDGLNGGPMALFDNTTNALFIAPFNNFMAASASHTGDTYQWGIMGGVNEVPRGFSYHTMVFYSAEGINQAMREWGEVMRFYYDKPTYYRDADFTNNYLSYWSDNGAYYVNYYVKDGLIQNMTYEEAMLEVDRYRLKEHIPYRSIQYSVWFKQGKYGGNSEMVANPELFKDGMKYMYEKTNLPATAHSRWWDPDTVYAKQNGGQYDFIVETLKSLPIEERFWRDMFRWFRQWGCQTYMQDWLNQQFSLMNATTQSVHVGRTWLMQMGEGARSNDVTIQYCMSQSRHVLQSLEIPVVTQARASDDYHPSGTSNQWRIGISAMFADAVGIAPFKDTFWTTGTQPGNYYNSSEPYPALQAVVSSLSAGPVGPGDMVNGTDVKLLLRCCAMDGLILKPSRPATAIDAQIKQEAFGNPSGSQELGPNGEVWTTHSDIGHHRFGIIFAADLSNSYSIGPTAAGFGREFPTSLVYNFEEQLKDTLVPFDDAHPLLLSPVCSKASFCLHYTAPVMPFGDKELILMGEPDKWIPISPQRVKAIHLDEGEVRVHLKGAAGERVMFAYALEKVPEMLTCVMSEAGTAVISFRRKECFSV